MNPLRTHSARREGGGDDGSPGEGSLRVFGYLGGGRFGAGDIRPQAALLERECRERGWTLVALGHELEREGDDGDARPVLEHALDRVATGEADALLVGRVEHLCRSIAEAATVTARLVAGGSRLVCLNPVLDTAGAVGRAAIETVIAISRWELERLDESRGDGLRAAFGRPSSSYDRPG